MKKKAIIISSIIAAVALIGLGVLGLSKDKVTAVNGEFTPNINLAPNTSITAQRIDVSYKNGVEIYDMPMIGTEINSFIYSTTFYVNARRYSEDYKFAGYAWDDGTSGIHRFQTNEELNVVVQHSSDATYVFKGYKDDTECFIVYTNRNIKIYALYEYSGCEVDYIPKVYETGVSTPQLATGGGTTQKTGNISTKTPVMILKQPVPNDGYKVKYVDIYSNGSLVLQIPEDKLPAGNFTVQKGEAIVYKESTGLIETDRDINVYVVFEKDTEVKGIWVEYTARPEARNMVIKCINTAEVLAEGPSKASYFVPYGFKGALRFSCDWLYWDEYWGREASIDGGPFGEAAGQNFGPGISYSGGNLTFSDWSNYDSMPKHIYLVDYSDKYKRKNDDKEYTKSEYPNQVLLACDPVYGGSASANPTMNQVPFTSNLVATPAKGYLFAGWTDENGVSYPEDQKTIQQEISGLKMYTAHFKPGVFQVRVASTEPMEGGSVTKGLGYYNYEDTPEITIEANDTFELESWSYISIDGVKHSNTFKEGIKKQTISLPKITEDIDLHITFRSLEFDVNTYPASDSGDSTSFISKIVSTGNTREVRASKGETLYLRAKAAEGYVFQYWTNNKGDVIKGRRNPDASYTAEVTVMAPDSFVAHFAKNKLEYHIETNCLEKIGTISYDNPSTSITYEESKSLTIEATRGDEFLIKAHVKDANYIVKKWLVIDPEGKQTEIPDDPSGITITTTATEPSLDGRYVYRAIFEKKQVEISAAPSIPGKGEILLESNGVTSRTGSITVDAGALVKITYITDNENNYWVTKWKNEAGTELTAGAGIDDSSNPIKFTYTLTANKSEKITAELTKLNPMLYVQSAPFESGQVQVNGGYPSSFVEYAANPFESISIKALPNSGFKFLEWRVDGNPIPGATGSNPSYTITGVEDDITYEAVFVEAEYKFTVAANNDTYGNVAAYKYDNESGKYISISVSDPKAGYGDKIKLTATPKSDNYEFDHWEDGLTHDVLSNDAEYIIENYQGPDNRSFRAVFIDKSPVMIKIVAADNEYAQYITFIKEDGTKLPLPAEIEAHKGEMFRLDAELLESAPYKFVEWYTDKPGESGSRISLTSISAGIEVDALKFEAGTGSDPDFATIKIRLEDIKYTVSGKSVPANGGTVRINNKDSGSSKIEAKRSDLVKLYAIPQSGYVFDYWSDGSKRLEGEKLGSDEKINVLTLPAVTSDENITAYFVKEQVKVEFVSSPGEDKGYIKATFDGVEGRSGEYIPLNTRVTLKASPKQGCKFVKWEWTDWKTGTKMSSTESILDFTDIDADVKFTAFFRDNTHKVTFQMDIADNPSLVGINPATGVGEISNLPVTPGTYGLFYNITASAVPDGTRMILKYKVNPDKSSFLIEYIKDDNGKIYSDFKIDSEGNYLFETPGITEDISFMVYCAEQKGTLTIKASPNDVGLVRYGTNDFVSSGQYTITKNSNVTVEAKATDPSYRFKNFEYILPGQTADLSPVHYSSTNNPLTIFNAGDAWKDSRTTLDVIAVFEKIKSKVTVASAPSTGGSVLINNEFKELSVGTDESFALIAVPNEGYSFDYFSDSHGSRFPRDLSIDNFDNGYLRVDSISEDTTYTAHFSKDNLNVTVYATPEEGGTVTFKNEKPTTYGGFTAEYEENFTLVATPEAGYRFERWDIEGSDGNKTSVTTNPYNVTSIRQDTTYTAVFTEIKNKVKTAASPLNGGRVTFDDGSTEIEIKNNESVKIIATPSEGYYLDCLKDSKGEKYEGVENQTTGEYTFTIPNITREEVFTGYFLKEQLSVTVSCIPSDAGFLEVNGQAVDSGYTETVDGSGSVTVSVRVKDADVYKFVRWEDDDGNTYVTNPLTLNNIKKSVMLTAILDKDLAKTGIKVVCSPAIGGHTTKVFNDKSSATITATENVGYRFIYWKKGSEIISRSMKTTVTDLSDGTVYTACFEKDANYKPKSSIADEKFYNEKRKQTSPSYSVTESKIKSQASTQVQKDKSDLANSLPANKTYAAYGKVKQYFENHRKNNKYVFSDGELFTTKDEQMDIKMIPTNKDVLAIAKDFSYKKYGKIYDTEILAAVDVTMPEDFAEGPRTYIWKNIDAEFKDNVYVLYLTKDNDDYKWSTGVYDMYDDVEEQFEALRFSIPGNGRIYRIVAVKVSIKEN